MRKTLFIIFLWFSGVAAGMQFAKFSAAIGLIQIDVGISPVYSGWLLSSLGIISIIFGVTSGVIVSRFSPVKMVIAFLWWASAASFLQAIFSQPGVMLAVRLLEGFSQLILVSAAPTALLVVAPKQYQALVMTLWSSFFGAAFLAMNVLQGLLIQWDGWKGIFYGHALFSAVVAMVLLLFLKMPSTSKIGDQQNHNKISFISQHKSVYKETGSLLPGLLFCCHTLMYLVFLTYLPQRFNHSYPEELLKSNFLQISMPFFSLFGTFLSGVILNRIRKSPLILIKYTFCTMLVLCTLLIINTESVFFLSAASFILLCSGILQGAIFAAIPYLSDDSTIHAYANGAITQMGNIGTSVGPPIFSMLLIYFGWNIAFIFPVISSLAGILIVFAFREKINSAVSI